MVIENGKIVFVGSNDEALTLAKPRSRTVDLKWNTVLPGIHDNHMHPLEAGSTVGGTCKLPADTPPDSEKMLKIFRDGCFKKQIGTTWALGHGHSVWTMLDYVQRTGQDPKKLLDDLIVDDQGQRIPALMMEETSHSFWVNSEALAQAGIDNTVQDRDGMIYMRNPETNEVNGVLLENAGISIMEFAMDPLKFPALKQLAYDGLRAGLYELAKHGITSAVDARSYWTREHDKAWERARDEGTLTAKAILSMWAYPEKDDAEQIPKLKTFFDNSKTSRLRKSQIKVYMDGLLNTRTATVVGGYLDNSPDLGIGNNGVNYFNSSRLELYMKELQDILDDGSGFDFIVHTVGDKAVRDMLDAVEKSKPNDGGIPARHKATHIELVHKEDRNRFKTLGVIADGQVRVILSKFIDDKSK